MPAEKPNHLSIKLFANVLLDPHTIIYIGIIITNGIINIY